ncbi:uncharacterized protein [Haliotis asinina]|uniref:uncharacterized protein isoform X1 n=1 Tax=Haliotis asinina TaxID=109174 RepID=UPI003531EF74
MYRQRHQLESSTTSMSSTVSDPDSLQLASIGLITAVVTSGTFIIAFFLILICILIFGARRRKRNTAVVTTHYIIYRGPNSITVCKENISIKQHPSPHDDHRYHRLKPSPRLNYLDYQAYVGIAPKEAWLTK